MHAFIHFRTIPKILTLPITAPQFWNCQARRPRRRAHPRVHQLPYRTIEYAGRLAIVTRFESVTDSASLEVISDYETYEVLRIYGGDR